MTDLQVETVYVNSHTISQRSHTNVPAFRPYKTWWTISFTSKASWYNGESKKWNFIRNMTSQQFISKDTGTKSLFFVMNGTPGNIGHPFFKLLFQKLDDGTSLLSCLNLHFLKK